MMMPEATVHACTFLVLLTVTLAAVPSNEETQPTVVPSALPSGRARALAAIVILIGGACGAMIGYSFAELQCTGDCTTAKGIGLAVGAVFASVGVAIVAVLSLRAMDEWQTITERGRKKLDS
jgi:hypothetical protein